MSSNFYREQLGKPYKKLYDAMLEWFSTDLTAESDVREFDIKGVEANGEDVSEVISAVLNDHPGIVCLGHSKSDYGYLMPPPWINEEGHLVISMQDRVCGMSFAYTAEERKKKTEEVEKWKRSVLERVKGNTDIEKIVSLTGIFATDFTYLRAAPSFDIAGVVSKRIVCEAFGRAFKVICDELGIWCIMVFGHAGSPSTPKKKWDAHCWNIVRIDNKYYHVDSTWANTTSLTDPAGLLGNGRKVFSYGFMLMDDKDISNSHTMLPDSYPKCNDGKLEYYRSKGWIRRFSRNFDECLTGPEEMRKMIRKMHGAHGDVYVLRCRLLDEDGKIPTRQKARDLIGRLTAYTIPNALGLNQGSYRHHGFDDTSGNYIMVFNTRATMRRKGNERIDAV